jgi:hypothetical protein
MILALALVSNVAWEWNPPARYDHPYPGTMIVRLVHPRDVPAACRALFARAGRDDLKRQVTPTNRGCAYWSGDVNTCWIVAVDRPTPDGRTTEAVIRHERGHCNGWHHSHPE